MCSDAAAVAAAGGGGWSSKRQRTPSLLEVGRGLYHDTHTHHHVIHGTHVCLQSVDTLHEKAEVMCVS